MRVGIRTPLPVVRWSQQPCAVCDKQVWVPGERSDGAAACADHDEEPVVVNLATYLKSITSS